MSLNCGAQGAFAALAVDDVGATFGASSERYEFIAENTALRERIVKGVGVNRRPRSYWLSLEAWCGICLWPTAHERHA